MDQRLRVPCLLVLAATSCVALGAEPAKVPPKVASAPARCLQQTGTLLPPGKWSCAASPGRSYSGAELSLTGETSVAAALKKLDVSVR